MDDYASPILLLMLAVLLRAVPAVVAPYDDTLTVSFGGYADSSPTESYAGGSTVIIPYGSTVWIGATQYPGGTWEVTVPNLSDETFLERDRPAELR